MDDAQQIQEKMRSLGERYLRRTYLEIDQMEATLARLRAGSTDGLKELERMMHKIRGSGAMFGFATLSDCAAEGELLCASSQPDPSVIAKLETHARELRVHVLDAAKLHNVLLENGPASLHG
ncbi:MAG: Hpt domain-containing protein [Povalibacter sp.]